MNVFCKKLLTFIQEHKKLALGLLLTVLICVACMFIYASHKNSSETIPAIHTISSNKNAQLPPYTVLDAAQTNGKTISKQDASDITRLANRSASTEKAYAHSITTDETIADNTAKEIAKEKKADMIIKQTTDDKQASNDKINVQDNNYYVINQERKHDVKAGCAYVDNSAYATISYRNRQVEYTAMYNPSTHQAGAMVQVTVARW
jgi:hypothetical protein